MKARVYSTWLPGEERDFLLDSTFAPAAGADAKCLPSRSANWGIVCVGFVRDRQEGPFRLKVKLRNTSNFPISPQLQDFVRFGVQIGP